ncbi:MAG: GNAT family N-acetyltransferase [Fusobacteria bacterium]|nr:GNAT family N-acetyltransferase [Fusobacteriota bacterium]
MNEVHSEKAIIFLKTLPMNTIFVQTILRGKSKGKYFFDSSDTPEFLYVRLDYAMSFLCILKSHILEEDIEKALEFYKKIKSNYSKTELLQVYPFELKTRIMLEFPHGVDHKRVNFTFHKEQFQEIYLNAQKKYDFQELIFTKILRKVATEEAFNFEGVVVPKYFWENEVFENDGSGCGVFINKKLVTLAFSAMRFENEVEIGIETLEEVRGRNYAFYACLNYIQLLLKNGLVPIWSCKGSNVPSKKLAKKLGFSVRFEIPYIEL